MKEYKHNAPRRRRDNIASSFPTRRSGKSLRRRQTWITPCQPTGAARGKELPPHLSELRNSTVLSAMDVEHLRSSADRGFIYPVLRYAGTGLSKFPSFRREAYAGNHAHHLNHTNITVQTMACDARRQCRDVARNVSTIPNAAAPPPHAVIAGLTRNPVVCGRLRAVARNDGTEGNGVGIHRFTPSEPMNRMDRMTGNNKGEALTSPCVGQRPTPINQHPYQALKGRHHGMGNGCRPFRAYGTGQNHAHHSNHPKITVQTTSLNL